MSCKIMVNYLDKEPDMHNVDVIVGHDLTTPNIRTNCKGLTIGTVDYRRLKMGKDSSSKLEQEVEYEDH